MELIITTAVICGVILLLMQKTRWPAEEHGKLSASRWSYSKSLVFAFWFTLTFTAAFRVGFQDTGIYKSLYRSIGTDYANAFREDFVIRDYGFNLYMVFLNRISPDPQLLIAVSAVVILAAYTAVLVRYSSDLPVSLLLFLFVAYIATMNGIRQVMASALIALAWPCLQNRRPVRFALVVLLASTLHASAIVLIPLYFVISGKRYNPGVLLFILLVVLCFAFPTAAYRVMGTVLEDSVYEEYLENESKMGMMRLLTELVPVIISFIYHRLRKSGRVSESGDGTDEQSRRMVDVLINMQMVSLGFTAMGLQMVYFARLSMYFALVLPLLLPVTIPGVFNRASAKLVKRIAVVMYGFYFAYQVYTYEMIDGWGGMELIF